MDEPEEVLAAKQRYKWWDATFASKGKLLDGTPEERQQLAATDQKFVWSLLSEAEGNVYINGFFPDDAYHFILSEIACDEDIGSVWIATDINLSCGACNGEGFTDDNDCEECDGEGSIFWAVD